MPGLGGRISTLTKAKISHMLDHAEDPAETLDYAYERQLEDLQNVKKGIADVVTAKKRLQMQEEQLHQQVSQARRPGAGGDVRRTGGSRPRRARAQADDRSGDELARSTDLRARVPAGEADRGRAAASNQGRAVPLQEGGHQGSVLGGRGAGADLRGGYRGGRLHGRRRDGDAARDRQDRPDAGAGVGGRGATGGRHVRRLDRARPAAG